MYCAHCHRTCACCPSTVAIITTSERHKSSSKPPAENQQPTVETSQVESQVEGQVKSQVERQVQSSFDFERTDFLSSTFLQKHAQAGMVHLHKHVQQFGVAVVRSVYQTMQRADEQGDPHITALFVPSTGCTLGEFAVHHVLKNEDAAKQRQRKKKAS